MNPKPLPFSVFFGWGVLAAAFWFFLLLPARSPSPWREGLNNLRQIGQASLAYAADHQDRLPNAQDVWRHAAELARGTWLNDASIWVVDPDPANVGRRSRSETVLTADAQGPGPRFLKMKPSWAVALGELNAGMPTTTPIAWTRGLRRDGTWAPHSPYGEDGGHVVFLAGNVRFYRDVKNALARFDGTGTTSDIMEALPPGARIGEYVPDDAEQREWAAIKLRQDRNRALWRGLAPVAAAVVWLGVLLLMIERSIRRQLPGWAWGAFLLMNLFMAAKYLPEFGKLR